MLYNTHKMIPKSLKSIFSQKNESDVVGSHHHRSRSTGDSSSTEHTDKLPSILKFAPDGFIGGFLKSHSRQSSSTTSPSSEQRNGNIPGPITVGNDSKSPNLVLASGSPTGSSDNTAPNTLGSPKSPTSPQIMSVASPSTLRAHQTSQSSSPIGHTDSACSPPSDTNSPEKFPSLENGNSDEMVMSEPGEINDAGYDSDDHEDDEDDDDDDVNEEDINYSENTSPDPLDVSNESLLIQRVSSSRSNIINRRLSRPHLHMEEADAESIIGGIVTRDSTPPDADQRMSHQTSDPKTFSFSLPFSNPLASLEFPNFKLPSIFSNDNNTPKISSEEYAALQMEVDDRLYRQMSVSSAQEDSIYNTVRQQDNSRLRAMRQAFTPNISIDSLNPLSSPKQDTFPPIEGDVVILGGYRGSILRDRASGRRVWIPIKAGFNLRKIDLTIGPKDEDEIDMLKKIYPDGMLTHIGPLDVSRKLIKKLRSNPNCKVHEFGYDWRLSSDINSERLYKFLKALPSNRNFDEKTQRKVRRKGAIVIAHSMGGLIAHHAMQKDPTIFRALLYAGVPSSCPNILGPLKHGDSVLLSSKILTQQVNFLMRSSYVFLPLNGRCFVNKTDSNVKYEIDFFDVNTWIKYELSPMVVKPLAKRRATTGSEGGSFNVSDVRNSLNNFTRDRLKGFTFTTDVPSSLENGKTNTFTLPDQKLISYDEAVEYLDRTLKRTKKFLLELDYDESKADLYPPLASIYSYSVPTLRGSKVGSREEIRTDIYDDLLFGAGDGVIYHKWLMPEPKGFKVVAKISTDRGHVGLLNDIDAVGRALWAILAKEKETVASPVTSSISSTNGVLDHEKHAVLINNS